MKEPLLIALTSMPQGLGILICQLYKTFNSSHQCPFGKVTVLTASVTTRLMHTSSRIWCQSLHFPTVSRFTLQIFYCYRPTLFKLSPALLCLPLITKLASPSFRAFIVKFLPFPDVQKLRKMIDIMHLSSVNILKSKKTALQQGDEAVSAQVGRGKDIMSILRVSFWYPTRSDTHLTA